MCRSASDPRGPKRCLRHSSATTATVRYTESKTGTEREQVYETIKELNKEGRKLDAPELGEVKAYFSKEKFVVNNDPDLNERERKLIMKNLEKAATEAEQQGVTGGAFHAWKNVFKRTMEKMKRPLAALAIAGVLAGSLAACTGGDGDKTPAPNPSGTSNSVSIDLGDAKSGPIVKDEYGSYEKVVVDPGAVPFKEDVVNKETFKEYGLTMDDAKKAQETAVKYIVEDVVDNPAFDYPADKFDAAYEKWYKENGERVYPGWSATGPASAEQGKKILTRLYGTTTRDGKPRIEDIKINVTQIYAYQTESKGAGISVVMNYDTGYRISTDWIKKTQKEGPVNLGEDTNHVMDSGKYNVITFHREAFVNTVKGKISGYNFPASSQPEVWFYNNQRPSKL